MVGFRGWLALALPCLIVTGLLCVPLVLWDILLWGTETPYGDFSRSSAHWWSWLLLFDGLARIALFLLFLFLLVLWSHKAQVLPKVVVWFFGTDLLVTFVALVSVVVLVGSAGGLKLVYVASFLFHAIMAGAWIPYFILSKRVRNAFGQTGEAS